MATATGSDLLPTRSHELLQRADAELVAAQFSSEAWERFSHAHLAALRGGAALLAVRGRPGGRRPPRTVWDMLRVVAPELARWSDYFAGGPGRRARRAGPGRRSGVPGGRLGPAPRRCAPGRAVGPLPRRGSRPAVGHRS